MIKALKIGTLEGPMMPVDATASHAVARAWAITTTRPSQVVVKRVPHFQLVREVICNLLAQIVELPVPTPYVLDTRGSDWDDGEHPFAFATDYEGYSSLLGRARQSPSTVQRLAGWPKFHATVAFDEWIANDDRTLSNLLLAGPRNFLLIDHGESLPNHMSDATKFRNGLARHLVASETSTNPHDLARRVKTACAHFGHANFAQLAAASHSGAWDGTPQFAECLRLLEARLNRLPELIEEEFRLGQGQLLA